MLAWAPAWRTVVLPSAAASLGAAVTLSIIAHTPAAVPLVGTRSLCAAVHVLALEVLASGRGSGGGVPDDNAFTFDC